MRYTLFVRHRPDGSYQASVPIMPGITEVGATREAAIQALERAIRAELASAEFVSIELPDTPVTEANPWLATAGSFADDPTLEPMLREIYAARDAE